jgi:hypothetical protein
MGFRDLFKTADQLAEKTLNEFNGVEGLKEVIKGILSLKDSEIYEMFYKASVEGHEKGISVNETEEDLLEFSQVKLAYEVLKTPPLYLPSLNDVIISTHFIAMMHVIIWRYYTCTNKNLSQNDLSKAHTIILERIMILLDDFDKSGEFQNPNKEFYQKLRKIKWNKEGKKLFWKLSNIRADIQYNKWGSTDVFRSGENFALTFLAACNAVNQDRGKILSEDVVVAYKTYLKLMDTDITKLEV